MKISAKQAAFTAVLLTLAIVSQFLKNLSVYLTGPIINLILMTAVSFCGLLPALILSVITPVTSFLITGSPLMAAIPVIIPCVMLGNAVLVLVMWLIRRKNGNISLAWLLGAIVKSGVMAGLISGIVIPTLGPSTGLPAPALAAARFTFSATQLITACIGGILFLAVRAALKKAGFGEAAPAAGK